MTKNDTMRLTIDGTRIYDARGRELLLRGINAGGRSKVPPFMPFAFQESRRPEQRDAPPFEEAVAAYFDRLASWDLSVIRMPFSWEALEPERGHFDERYLARYEALARAAGERGMRVIVDFHQDVFARPYAGDGFPLWACPQPTPPCADADPHWFMGYVQNEQVKRAFDRFWGNEDGLRDAFAGMWRYMAERLWRVDAVVAFEIINEPGWGSASLGSWGAEVLTPFYSELIGTIREVAADALILFDSTGADALSGRTGLERPEGDALIFAPHFYAPEVIMEGRWDGNSKATEVINSWAELGAKWDIPVLLGEFGITPGADGSAGYVRANYDKLDEVLMHGTLWECSTTSDDWNDEDMSVLGPGGVERETVAELVRAYPYATAGRLLSFRFDAAQNSGELSFEANGSGVSEVRAPKKRFTQGVEATLEGVSGTARYDDDSESLIVTTEGEGTARVRFGQRDVS